VRCCKGMKSHLMNAIFGIEAQPLLGLYLFSPVAQGCFCNPGQPFKKRDHSRRNRAVFLPCRSLLVYNLELEEEGIV
jgi:hypothetical protein